jgi:hypothetical protein
MEKSEPSRAVRKPRLPADGRPERGERLERGAEELASAILEDLLGARD